MMDAIFNKDSQRFRSDAFDQASVLVYRKTRLGTARLNENILPTYNEEEQYLTTHPIHGAKHHSLIKQHDRTDLGTTGCVLAAATSAAAVVATGGLALIVAGPSILGAASGISHGKELDQKIEKLEEGAAREFKAGCLDYKIKRLIAKGKLPVDDAIDVVRRFR
jgi:hypothetical protein